MFAFDARAAKALKAGQHLTFEGAPGLRLVATTSTRTWTYRYKSPVTDGMKQVCLGHWPAMSAAAALLAWEGKRGSRDAGLDPAADRRAARAEAKAERKRAQTQLRASVYTVKRLCDDHLAGYKGTVVDSTYREAARLFGRELDSLNDLPAIEVTRAHAFSLLDVMRDRPMVARQLRHHLGAAWDRALDAGKLPPECPNWWRLVLRGRLPSKGKRVAGERLGTGKRVLSNAELTQVLRWLPNFTRDVEDALTLYLWTLCRGAEIVSMERKEITTEAGVRW